jgi:hypothetical protein
MAKIGRQGDGGGRPTKTFSKEDIAKIYNLSSKLTKTQLADYMGVAFSTFREIEKRQPEVAEAYQKGKAEQIEEVVGHLLDQCRKGNITGIIFYLKTQAGWKEEQQEVKEIPQLQVVVSNDEPHKAAV